MSLSLHLYLIYIGVSFLSCFWNALAGRVSLLYSLVFVIRPLEYVAFYFIGYSLARSRFGLLRVARWYAGTMCVVIPLQMIGVVPLATSFPRTRASGNTNGPYELAIVCAFLLCFVAYRKRQALIGVASVVLIVATASRITLIATLLSLLHFGMVKTRAAGRLTALAAVLAMIGGGAYMMAAAGTVKGGALGRLQNSNSLSLDDVREVYNAAPVETSSAGYLAGSFEDINSLDFDSFEGDLSGYIRFSRWLVLSKSALAHVDSTVLGLGPSFGSAAVDGYFTRCFVETGVLGLAAFLAFLGGLIFERRGSNWYFREFVLIMIVSAIFIDVFLSYKSMLLLWLWHGWNQYRRRTRRGARKLAEDGPSLMPEAVTAAGLVTL